MGGGAGVEEVGNALVEVGQRDEADDHDDEGECEGDENALLATGELDVLGDLGGSCAMGLLGVLELLHGQDGGTLIGLDLLGVLHDEEDGDEGGHDPQHGAQANDDGLVDLDANAAQGVDGSADGERVDGGTQATAAGTQKYGGGADQRVEAGGHHGGGEQSVEGHGLLAHTIGGTAEGEDEHQDGDDHELVALELLDQDGDAVIKGTGLGHHAKEAAEDHDEQAYGERVRESANRSHEEVIQTGSGDFARGDAGDGDGNESDDGQQDKKNGER